MAVKKHESSLRLVFLQYLLTTVLALVVAVLIPYGLFSAGIYTGLFSYANTSEMQAKSAEPAIASAKAFDSKLVPASCTYVLLSQNHAVLQSNMKKEEIQNAVGFLEKAYTPATPDDCFLVIRRSDGVCILHYHIGSLYNIEWMNQAFPSPDKLLIILIAINCLLGCFIVMSLFARKLRRHLHPVLEATEKIREQDLDFEVNHSGIKEFDHILLSISDMKSELSESLEKQWRMEQTRREQTSALAHDIRTPLTIIRGNAELLNDSALTEKQQEYALHILKNSKRMEQYLNTLIDLTKAEAGYSIHPGEVWMEQFVKELEEQTKGLAAPKQIQVEFRQNSLPEKFTVDATLLGRAIINVVSNAMEYTPECGTVSLLVEKIHGLLRFQVSDSGNGFSPEDLKQAATQFYRGDKSRSSKDHFGMGLFIAKSVAEKHGGALSIANSKETGGGMVTIGIPILG